MGTLKKYVVSASTVLILVLAIQVGFATKASAVTTADISEQRLVVMSELVDVLTEQVTFIQLVIIHRLENQVAQLEAQIEAQR